MNPEPQLMDSEPYERMNPEPPADIPCDWSLYKDSTTRHLWVLSNTTPDWAWLCQDGYGYWFDIDGVLYRVCRCKLSTWHGLRSRLDLVIPALDATD